MPVPVVLATTAAVGSIITSVKSGWELRRMIKRKQEQIAADDEAPFVFRRLRRAHRSGILTDKEYEDWYEKFLVARAERDLPALHRIRAHMRIIEAGAPGKSMEREKEREREREISKSSSRSRKKLTSSESKSRRRSHSLDDAAPSPRRSSASPRERRRKVKKEESESEEEDSDYYERKKRTRRRKSSRSHSDSAYDDASSARDPRREMTWPPSSTGAGGIEYYFHQRGDNVKVGAPPEQFVRPPPVPALPEPGNMKRASTATATGYAGFAGYGAPLTYSPAQIPVPKLMPVPRPVKRRSSSSSTAARRYQPESETDEGDSESESEPERETPYDEKKWMKKQLPPPRRNSRKPWEKEQDREERENERRRPWERDQERDERRERVKA